MVSVDDFYKKCNTYWNGFSNTNQAKIYLFKFNTTETLEKGVKMRSKSTIKTPERRQWRRSGDFIVDVEYIPHLF